MLYSHNSLYKILNCFSKHNVNISFEKNADIKKALNEIVPLSTEIHLKENQKNLFFYETIEYNLTKQIPISLKKWYPYGYIYLLADKKISNHLNYIRSNIICAYSGLFDIDNCYSLVSKSNNNFVDYFSYRLSIGNLLGNPEDSFLEFLKKYDMPIFLNDTRNIDTYKFWVSSVDMNHQSNPINICFQVSPLNLLNSGYSEEFRKYNGLKEISEIIFQNCEEDDEAKIGFDLNTKSFFLEIFPVNFDQTLSEIKELNLYDDDYVKSIYLKDYSDYTLKFYWKNVNNLSLTLTKICENPNRPQV